MIFVTVGTTYFDELVEEVDRLVDTGLIRDRVVAQVGEGRYTPRNLEWFRYAPTLKPYYDQADLVIGHGGTGTVFDLLRMGKPFVAVANRALAHDHQADLLRAIDRRRWCRCCYDLKALGRMVRAAAQLEAYDASASLVPVIWQEVRRLSRRGAPSRCCRVGRSGKHPGEHKGNGGDQGLFPQ